MNLQGSCTLNLKLAGNAAVSIVRSRCRQMCRRWRSNHTVSSNYGLRFCPNHLTPNTSKGRVLLYETYRGIPTRFQNTNKAANTRIRITFIVQAHTPCSHLLPYKHSRHISTLHHIGIFHRIRPSRQVGTIHLISTSRRISTNLHHTSTQSNNVRDTNLQTKTDSLSGRKSEHISRL